MINFEFKKYFVFLESIQDNFDSWLDAIKNYAKPNEQELKKIVTDEVDARKTPGSVLLTDRVKAIIIKVLQNDKKENQNYLKYALGYFLTKPDLFEEDLKAAVDALNWKISNGSLTRKQLEQQIGWFHAGMQAEQYKQEKLNSSVTSGEILRMKKSGVGGEDLKLVVDKNNVKIFYTPPAKTEHEIETRHIQLCRYGAGTEWCTAQPSWDAHLSYKNNNIYIIYKNNEPTYQFVAPDDTDNRQFMNIYDKPQKFIDKDVYNVLQETMPNVIEIYKLKIELTREEFTHLDNNAKYKYSMDHSLSSGADTLKYANAISFNDPAFKATAESFLQRNYGSNAMRLFAETGLLFAAKTNNQNLFDFFLDPIENYNKQIHGDSEHEEYSKFVADTKYTGIRSFIGNRTPKTIKFLINNKSMPENIRLSMLKKIMDTKATQELKLDTYDSAPLEFKKLLFLNKEQFENLPSLDKKKYLSNLSPRMWRKYLPEQITDDNVLFDISPDQAIKYAALTNDQKIYELYFNKLFGKSTVTKLRFENSFHTFTAAVADDNNYENLSFDQILKFLPFAIKVKMLQENTILKNIQEFLLSKLGIDKAFEYLEKNTDMIKAYKSADKNTKHKMSKWLSPYIMAKIQNYEVEGANDPNAFNDMSATMKYLLNALQKAAEKGDINMANSIIEKSHEELDEKGWDNSDRKIWATDLLGNALEIAYKNKQKHFIAYMIKNYLCGKPKYNRGEFNISYKDLFRKLGNKFELINMIIRLCKEDSSGLMHNLARKRTLITHMFKFDPLEDDEDHNTKKKKDAIYKSYKSYWLALQKDIEKRKELGDNSSEDILQHIANDLTNSKFQYKWLKFGYNLQNIPVYNQMLKAMMQSYTHAYVRNPISRMTEPRYDFLINNSPSEMDLILAKNLDLQGNMRRLLNEKPSIKYNGQTNKSITQTSLLMLYNENPIEITRYFMSVFLYLYKNIKMYVDSAPNGVYYDIPDLKLKKLIFDFSPEISMQNDDYDSNIVYLFDLYINIIKNRFLSSDKNKPNKQILAVQFAGKLSEYLQNHRELLEIKDPKQIDAAAIYKLTGASE
jgi:hypothetical protein